MLIIIILSQIKTPFTFPNNIYLAIRQENYFLLLWMLSSLDKLNYKNKLIWHIQVLLHVNFLVDNSLILANLFVITRSTACQIKFRALRSSYIALDVFFVCSLHKIADCRCLLSVSFVIKRKTKKRRLREVGVDCRRGKTATK